MDFTPEIELISKHVDFSPLQDKSILVTGATGFIGKWVQIALRAASKQGIRYAYFGVDHEGLDLLRADGMYSHKDYIIHLAPVLDTTYIKMFEAMTPTAFLYTSSGAVYHETPNAYGRMKIEHEALLKASKLPAKIARLFTFVGPYLDENKAIYQLLHDALTGDEINILGDGHTVRRYLYAADMVINIFNYLLAPNWKKGIDIDGEHHLTILGLAERIRKIVNPKARIIIHNSIEVEQAKLYFGRHANQYTDIATGIARMADWMKNEVIK